MFCFRAREGRTGWNVVLPNPSGTAVDPAALFAQAPDFAVSDSGHPVARISIPLAQDSAGLRLQVTVDEQGGIALAACPTKPDRAAAAALVRETLAFAGRYWRAGVEEFLKAVEPKLGKPLAAALKPKAGAGFDESQFRAGLGRSLELGRFPAFLLVSTLEGDMAAAVSYLHSLNIEVVALGVDVYESWGIEVALPHRHQLPTAAGGPARPVARPTPPPSRAQEPAPPRPAAPVSSPSTEAAPRPTQSFIPPPGFGKLEPDSKPEPDREPTIPAGPKVWDGTQAGVMAGKRPPPKPGVPPKKQR